ncbi:hypothetical protein V8E55_005361 [Tylopilus felleus]
MIRHELLASGPAADPSLYQATVFSSGAAVVLVIWDSLLTLDNEVNYIWSGSGRAHVRWIYLFSRWFGLLNQIAIQIWRCSLAAWNPVPLRTCEIFIYSEGVAFLILELCLDAILILRIWAVYRRQHLYIAIALVIVLFETLVSIMTQAISVPKSIVDGSCIILHTPTATTCLAVGTMISQIVLFGLIYRGKSLLQPAARRSKLITVVVRDGVLGFGVVIGTVTMTCVYFLFNQAVINVLIPWMLAAPTILTPRMILNMQMAAEPTESLLEFTTDLGIIPNSEIHSSGGHELTIIYEQPVDSP